MILDDPQLSTAAHVAQLVLGGTAALHLGVLRPHAARADLLLVLEMVHTDLSTDVHDGRMPALDPQVQAMARGLTLVRRLPRRAAVRALRAGEIGGRRDTPDLPWWDAVGTPAAPSALTPWQEARMAEFRETLDRAITAYLGSAWWRRLGAIAPRHRVGPREERILVPAPRTEAEVPDAPAPVPATAPASSPEPAVREIQLPERPALAQASKPRRAAPGDEDVEIGTLGLGDLIPLPRF